MEFAILVPVLLWVLFGILDYGLWFNDSLNARAAVRETAREGIVGDWEDDGTCDPGADSLRCATHERLVTITGDAYVSVVAEDWEQGSTLTVCTIVAADGVTGLVPMPDFIESRVEMAVERLDSEKQSAGTNSFDDLSGTGVTWGPDCGGTG